MKFSIITCTYNSAAYLQNTINSVKQQTNQDFEHIFIDGFSTDSTIDLIKKYQADYPDKVKWYQCPPKGISDAMNKGIEYAQGEYINHLHSDDTYYSEDVLQYVAKCITVFHQPEWLYGKAKFIDEVTGSSRIIPHRTIYHQIRFWLLLLTDYVPHQAIFLRKEIFQRYGMFNTAYKNRMDYDLWLRLAKNRVIAQFMNEIICNFSLRPDSQSVAYRYNDEHVKILKTYVHNKFIVHLLIGLAKINQKRHLF